MMKDMEDWLESRYMMNRRGTCDGEEVMGMQARLDSDRHADTFHNQIPRTRLTLYPPPP